MLDRVLIGCEEGEEPTRRQLGGDGSRAGGRRPGQSGFFPIWDARAKKGNQSLVNPRVRPDEQAPTPSRAMDTPEMPP